MVVLIACTVFHETKSRSDNRRKNTAQGHTFISSLVLEQLFKEIKWKPAQTLSVLRRSTKALNASYSIRLPKLYFRALFVEIERIQYEIILEW